MTPSALRILALIAKFAITLGLLAYLWFEVDAAAVFVQLRSSHPLMLLAGTLVLALLPVVGAARWRLILARLGAASQFRQVARWTYISVFFAQVLPATVGGDGLRIWLAHRAGFGIKASINSVGLDRIAMMLVLALLLAAVTPALGNLIDLDRLDYLAPILLATIVLGLVALMRGDRLPGRLQSLRAVRAIGHLAHDARRLFLDPRSAMAIAALALISYSTIIVAVSLFALAFGAEFAFGELAVLLPAVLVASSLPISIGGWGTREMAMVAALGSIQISPHIALLVSLWLGIASILVALPGAMLYLTDRPPLKPSATAGLKARP